MSELLFFNEECDIPSFFNEERVKQWLQAVADDYSFKLGTISFIFCNDDYILDVNRKYLNHDYYTDVITFDYSERKILSGDVFIDVYKRQVYKLVAGSTIY